MQSAMSLLCLLMLTVMVKRSAACSPYNFPESVGLESTLYTADVVVTGTARQRDEDDNLIFEVDCVLKSGSPANKIKRQILIDGSFYFNSCTTTWIEEDEEYIVALHNFDLGFGTYSVYEPNIGSSAAFKLEQLDGDRMIEVDDVLKICGFEAPYPMKGTNKSKACPVRREDGSAECEVHELPEPEYYEYSNENYNYDYSGEEGSGDSEEVRFYK